MILNFKKSNNLLIKQKLYKLKSIIKIKYYKNLFKARLVIKKFL